MLEIEFHGLYSGTTREFRKHGDLGDNNLFFKQVHFVPCPKITSACTLSTFFMQHVYRLNGSPKQIISSQGAVHFTILAGVPEIAWQGLSSTHHPQMNGGCEHINGVLEQYLRYYFKYHQDNWADLRFALVANNNAVYNSTGFTPFKKKQLTKNTAN